MFDEKTTLLISVAAVWIVVRLALMYRRNVLMKRRLERERLDAEQDVPQTSDTTQDV